MHSQNIYILEVEAHFESFGEDERSEFKKLYGAMGNSPESLSAALCTNPHILYAELNEKFSPDSWDLASELALEHGVDIDIAWATKEARESLKRVGFISPDARPGEANLPAIFAAIIARKLNHPATTLITLLGAEDEPRILDLAKGYGVGHKNAMLSLLNISEFFSTLEGAEAIAARLGNLEFLGAAFMIIELGGICFWREIFSNDANDRDEKVVEFVSAEEKSFENDMTETLMHAGVLFRVENDPMALAVVPEELWNGLWSLGNEWIQEWSRSSFYELHPAPETQSQIASLDLQSTLKWIRLELVKNEDCDVLSLEEKLPQNLRAHYPKYLDLADKIRVFKSANRNEINDVFLPTLDLQPDVFSSEMLNEWVCGFIELGGEGDTSFSSMMGLDESWRKYAHGILVDMDDFIPPWILKTGIPTNETGHGYLRDEEIGDEELQLEVTIVNRIFQRSKLLLLDLMSLLERDKWYAIAGLSEIFQMCCSASIFSHLSVVLNDPSLRLYVPLYRASFVGGELESGRAFNRYIENLMGSLFHPLGIVELSATHFRLKSRPLVISSLVFSEEERRQTIDEIFEGEFEFSLLAPKPKPSFFQVAEGLSITKSMEILVAESSGTSIRSFDGRFLVLE